MLMYAEKGALMTVVVYYTDNTNRQLTVTSNTEGLHCYYVINAN